MPNSADNSTGPSGRIQSVPLGSFGTLRIDMAG